MPPPPSPNCKEKPCTKTPLLYPHTSTYSCHTLLLLTGMQVKRWSSWAPLWVGVRGRSVRWWRPNPFSWSVPTDPLNYAHTQNSSQKTQFSQNYSDSNTNSGNHEEPIANTSNMDLQRETQHKDNLGVSVEWRFSGDWVSEGGRPMVCRKGCLSGLDMSQKLDTKNMKSNLNMSSSSSSSAWWRSSPLKSLWGDLSGVNYCDWRGQVAWPESPHTADSTISTVHMDTLKTLLQCNTFIDKVWPGGEFQFLQYSQMPAE